MYTLQPVPAVVADVAAAAVIVRTVHIQILQTTEAADKDSDSDSAVLAAIASSPVYTHHSEAPVVASMRLSLLIVDLELVEEAQGRVGIAAAGMHTALVEVAAAVAGHTEMAEMAVIVVRKAEASQAKSDSIIQEY